jgi:hypothetical protein
MECSSKEMAGVDEIFFQAINTVVANDKSNQQQEPQAGASGQTYGGGMKKKKRNCRFL